MITARDEVSGIQDALDAGAVDYLVKPVEPTALLARVRSALRTRHAFQQVRDLNQDLLAQKKELSNFTHMVSHDLKSPVVGAASLFNFFLYRLRDDYPEILEDDGMNAPEDPGHLHQVAFFHQYHARLRGGRTCDREAGNGINGQSPQCSRGEF